MKKTLCLLAIIFYSTLSFANEVTVKLEPREPVAGETFQLLFNIETQSQEEPFITFEPGQAEVVGRRNLGTSVQTTIINGKVSTKRTVRYAYDLVVANPGILRLSGIKVEMPGTTKYFDGITANVIREKRAPNSYFVRAEVPQKEIYLGEGVTLNYYLYFRVPIVGTEVRDFPKLNNLIKRFHLPSERVETIDVEGTLYRRQVAYSARVYPEKTGKIVIDPLKLRIQYSDQPTAGSPFSGFGFQSRQTQVRNVQSEEIELSVLPLPADGLPINFTGLIGKHEFNLTMPRNRFLVNEPVELRLEVIGPGALENVSAPIIFESQSLEQFDTMSEFSEIDREIAKKTFEYTYLARGPLERGQSFLNLNYFDPETKQYIEVPVSLPEIKVSGVREMQSSEPNAETPSKTAEVVLEKIVFEITGPFFKISSGLEISTYPLRFLNILLCVVLVFLLFKSSLAWLLGLKIQTENEELINNMRKNGINYSEFYNLFESCQGNTSSQAKGLVVLVKSLSLSEEAKRYFIQVYEELEKSSYDERKKPISLKFNKRFFKELSTLMEKETFENS